MTVVTDVAPGYPDAGIIIIYSFPVSISGGGYTPVAIGVSSMVIIFVRVENDRFCGGIKKFMFVS